MQTGDGIDPGGLAPQDDHESELMIILRKEGREEEGQRWKEGRKEGSASFLPSSQTFSPPNN